MSCPTETWTSPCGNATLLRADALELLTSKSDLAVDSVVTDPPYGIALTNHDKLGVRSRRRSHAVAGDGGLEAGMACLRFARDRRLPVVVFASPWRPWTGENWRNLIVWNKGAAVGGGGDTSSCLKRTWELIQTARTPRNGYRDESVWDHPVTSKDSQLHVCQKPLALMVRLLETFTKPGDVVLDPFAGSGTTGLAAIVTGRRFLGIEIEPTHYTTARNRLADACGRGLFAQRRPPAEQDAPLWNGTG